MTARDIEEPTRLMVRIEAGDGAVERLTAILASAPIAGIVISAPTDRASMPGLLRPLIEAGQKAGAAMLVEGDVQLAQASGADGLHLPVSDTSVDEYARARAALGAKAIIGVDAGGSRHDAMTLGENGADYVAFGIPPFVKDREAAVERQRELIAWWAELFEVPCVGMDVQDPQSAGVLAEAGADFVCMTVAGSLSLAELDAEARRWGLEIGLVPAPGPVA